MTTLRTSPDGNEMVSDVLVPGAGCGGTTVPPSWLAAVMIDLMNVSCLVISRHPKEVSA